MKTYAHTLTTKASKESIWELWSSVDDWNKWDEDIRDAEISGPFESGTIGYLKPIHGPLTRFRLKETHFQESFTVKSKLPLGRMYMVHEMKEDEDTLSLTHSIIFKGPLSFLYARVIGKRLNKELPNTMHHLIDAAETKTLH